MIRVIIKEELYDKDFVSKWTVGFEKLEQHIRNYSPDQIAKLTWVPKELLVRAARLYATSKPAHIEWGNALDHQLDSFQIGRALAILMALTGNIGVSGGETEMLGSGFRDADPDKESSQIGLRAPWLRFSGRCSGR